MINPQVPVSTEHKAIIALKPVCIDYRAMVNFITLACGRVIKKWGRVILQPSLAGSLTVNFNACGLLLSYNF